MTDKTTKSFSEFESKDSKPLNERRNPKPYDGDEAREILKTSIVEFSFIKKDGSKRHATGTLNIDHIPPSQHPNGRGSNDDDNLVKYYDIDKEDYRAFKLNELIDWFVLQDLYESKEPKSLMESAAFNKWIDTFFKEKGIDLDTPIDVEGNSGTNYMNVGVVVDVIKTTSQREQAAIKDTLVKIDVKNGDPVHYLKHLAQAIAK